VLSEKTQDLVARVAITAGGVAVILAVAGIVIAIAAHALPLVSRSSAGPVHHAGAPDEVVTAGQVRRSAAPWILTRQGSLRIVGSPGLGLLAPDDEVLSATTLEGRRLALVTRGGWVIVGRPRLADAGGPAPLVWDQETEFRIPPPAGTTTLSGARAEDGRLLLALTGPTDVVLHEWRPLTEEWTSHPRNRPGADALAVSEELNRIAVIQEGRVRLLTWPSIDELQVEALDGDVTMAEFLHGGRRLTVVTGADRIVTLQEVPRLRVENTGASEVVVDGHRLSPGGEVVIPGPAPRPSPGIAVRQDRPIWSVVARHRVPEGPVTALTAFHRGRNFAVASAGRRISIYNATAATRVRSDRWEISDPRSLWTSQDGATLIAGGTHGLAWRAYDFTHAAVTLRTLFGRTWYEGDPAPEHAWQPVVDGGAEPRYGLWPLLYGTLKATICAMVVSVPLALLAALYVSHLAPRWFKPVVKPVVEIMAAVPTVIVGFLGALWLAPLLERHLVEAATAAVLGPAAGIGALALFRLLPRTRNLVVPPTVELIGVAIAFGAGTWLAVAAAPLVEARLFAGDAVRWIWEHTGLRYEQRNGVVVGIALGFAVVPVIYTIADEAFRSVPVSQIQGARALGATRWQVARHLVLPASFPGLVAAVMLGFGRAVGETMIVLMVSGNTPLLTSSPLDGMRTISATLAMEVPGAALGSAHLRILFLAGTLLFLVTFVVSTIAGMVTRRLRQRHARV
jgi:ABC-type phosphate transport system permease subunit